MKEIEQRDRHTPIFSISPKPIDKKTLADVIKNAQSVTGTASISNLDSFSSVVNISEEQLKIINTPSLISSQMLRHEWVVPNRAVDKSIMTGNYDDYVFINCTFTKGAVGRLVLCEIYKDQFSDGSYKIRYSPVTASKLKRMPE